MTTAVAAAASVPASFTDTNTSWMTSEMNRAPSAEIPVKSATPGTKASTMPSDRRVSGRLAWVRNSKRGRVTCTSAEARAARASPKRPAASPSISSKRPSSGTTTSIATSPPT